ncbi:preprotein translocase subunit SecD [Natronomonas salsuginis]|uniref:Protein-export membrane protein SecD n=1 Tax=Natronomonas salsuginis TaxID=2217661 RepID=A0A4V5ZNW2_9EURY|nr:preprotein translocase subunit SecD [Natronomonas salsuginis]TKR25303.1 preprotein translocase subunit SecD [Natronomonas salsuginis]
MKLQLKENWRVWLLVVFMLLSTVSLFVPFGGTGGITGSDADQASGSQYTNLQFGLELSGGTQVRAPFAGMTVSGLEFGPEAQPEIESALRAELDMSASDVRASAESGTVEVFEDRHVGNVTQAEFAAALTEAGYQTGEGDVEMGVTADTRQNAEDVLNERLRERGLGGGSATQVSAPGQQFMVVEVPGANRSEVIELIGDRGQVEIWAMYPTDNGSYETQSLLSQEDLAEIGGARQEQGETFVPIRLNEEAGARFGDAMRANGFGQQGGTRCSYDLNASIDENAADDPGRCLLTVLDGEVVFAAGVAPSLASSFESGTFDENPSYRTTTTSFEDARELEINMRTGALRTELDIDNRGTTFFLLPSLAERFKPLSLVTGAAAVFAVALTVFARYRKPEVAAPMLLTAAAEVYILLGFAAAVSLPLDLSHIAGFIAVIGTGVDDLVIIADEVMQQGDVRTSRVFESRFKKAFWVIGAAAATTIVAMSPLAVLSLGDLQGFAIITIIGVLIGVLITRPAYGDILRILVLGDD